MINEVEFNQVVVSFGDRGITGRVIKAIQEDGTCWCGESTWKGRDVMRISVCSWATTEDDVELSLEAILRCAAVITGKIL